MAIRQEDPEALRQVVREKYAARAVEVSKATGSGMCCPADPVSITLYGPVDAETIPEQALTASLGCGNPTALAMLRPGEAVLDLGSGGGLDVLLAAGKVGPEGLVYGVDMTDEMLALAEANRQKSGIENARFLKGYIEDLPLPANHVDVVVSNCVINLSADKAQVLREALRVLKPGGRLAVSDVVIQGALPAEVRARIEAEVGCVAGALQDGTYRSLLAAAGFIDINIEVTAAYGSGNEIHAGEQTPPGRVVSAFISARKPS